MTCWMEAGLFALAFSAFFCCGRTMDQASCVCTVRVVALRAAFFSLLALPSFFCACDRVFYANIDRGRWLVDEIPFFARKSWGVRRERKWMIERRFFLKVSMLGPGLFTALLLFVLIETRPSCACGPRRSFAADFYFLSAFPSLFGAWTAGFCCKYTIDRVASRYLARKS